MTVHDQDGLLRAALAYAGRGWAVLPLWWPLDAGRCACRQPGCANAGKHPVARLVPHGLLRATTAPATVRAWWSAFPRANVGVRTGGASGLVVLDVDGEAGAAALRALVGRHGRFEAAWARTGSGGWHAYLSHPGTEVPSSARRLGPGLDVRGDGGYVVAPPSLHVSGRRYRWLRPARELPPMPDWLLELSRPPATGPVDHQPIRARGDGLSPYAVAAVEGEAREVAMAPAGQRNQRLFLAAARLGELVGGGWLSERAVLDVLLAAARAAGLSEREARGTIRSGVSRGRTRPRGATS